MSTRLFFTRRVKPSSITTTKTSLHNPSITRPTTFISTSSTSSRLMTQLVSKSQLSTSQPRLTTPSPSLNSTTTTLAPSHNKPHGSTSGLNVHLRYFTSPSTTHPHSLTRIDQTLINTSRRRYWSFATLATPPLQPNALHFKSQHHQPQFITATTAPLGFVHHLRNTQLALPLFSSRRSFTSTYPQRIFQQGLGRAGQSRSRLGAVSKPEPAKIADPLGIEAKQKRLEAQLQAMKEGKEYDQFAGLTEEQRAKQLEYLAQMKRMEDTMGWIEFILSQSSTYYLFWYIILGSTCAISYYVYVKFILDPDDMPMLNAVPGLRDMWDGKIPKDSYEYNEKFLKTLATADQIADTAKKFADPNYIHEVEHKTHGSIKGAYEPTGPESFPKPQEWRTRASMIRTFVHAGLSYPDYVGNGHFHIYHNGKDNITKILERIQKDNFGMPFTFQILSFAEIHQILTTPYYKPRSMEQLDKDEKEGIDSTEMNEQLREIMGALDSAKSDLDAIKANKVLIPHSPSPSTDQQENGNTNHLEKQQ